MYKQYGDKVQFLLVYIREAHPGSVILSLDEESGENELKKILQTDSLAARLETAKTCTASLKLSIPTVVDNKDNRVNAAYAGWPDRLAVVGTDGKIAYYGRPGPSGFKPNEVESWLKQNVK